MKTISYCSSGQLILVVFPIAVRKCFFKNPCLPILTCWLLSLSSCSQFQSVGCYPCHVVLPVSAIDSPRRLLGTSYLTYTSGFSTTGVQLPWYAGIAFRSRQQASLLMTVMLDSDQQINIKVWTDVVSQIIWSQPLCVQMLWWWWEVRMFL